MSVSLTSRWWADPDQALEALGLVDGSDVLMGVGTSVLGYHGLCLEELLPLADTTMVDAGLVASRLARVDIDPVADAVSKAVAPVLGAAADTYGAMWAKDLHARAVQASQGLFMSLTSTGMAYPSAVDRIVVIHGIPTEFLGPVAKHLREPRTSSRILDDWADRALMEYALHRGRLESAGVEPVAKAVAFREGEHPRASDGRFRTKSTASGGQVAPDRRLARLKRLKRLNAQAVEVQQVQAQLAAQAQRQASRPAMKPLTPARTAPPALSGPFAGSVLGMVWQRAQAQQRAMVQVAEELGIEVEEVETPWQASEDVASHTLSAEFTQNPGEVVDQGVLYYPITRAEAVMLQKHDQQYGSFSAGGMQALIRDELRGYTLAQALTNAQQRVNTEGVSLDDIVFLEVGGDVPLDEGQSIADLQNGELDYVTMPQSAILEVDWDMSAWDNFHYDEDITLEGKARKPWEPADSQDSKQVPILRAQLANWKDYPSITPGRVHKNFQFREADVVRDDHGRFAPEHKGAPGPRGVEPAVDSRAKRLRRLRRLAVQAQEIQQVREQAEQAAAAEQQAAERRRMTERAAPARPALAPVNGLAWMNTGVVGMAQQAARRPKAEQATGRFEGKTGYVSALNNGPVAAGEVNPFGEIITEEDLAGFASPREMQDDFTTNATAFGETATMEELVADLVAAVLRDGDSRALATKTRSVSPGFRSTDRDAAVATAESWAKDRNSHSRHPLSERAWFPFVTQNTDGSWSPKAVEAPRMAAVEAFTVYDSPDVEAAMNENAESVSFRVEMIGLRELAMETGLDRVFNLNEIPDVKVSITRVLHKERA